MRRSHCKSGGNPLEPGERSTPLTIPSDTTGFSTPAAAAETTPLPTLGDSSPGASGARLPASISSRIKPE